MKTKTLFYTLFFLSFIFSTTSFSQNKIKYGVKGGIGFWRFMSLNDIPKTGKYPIYSYPIGFSLGLFSDYKLSNEFSLVNEIIYQNSIAKITIYSGVEDIVDKKVTSQFINLPVLLKYDANWLGDTYFLLGPSFAYLVKANYYYFIDISSGFEENIDITNNLPNISASIELSIGKNLKITDIDFLMELRAQLGITKFHYEDRSVQYDIRRGWRNLGLSLFIGLQL